MTGVLRTLRGAPCPRRPTGTHRRRCRRPGRPPRDDHLGRAQNAIVEAVADAVDAGDLPLVVDGVLFVGDGLVDVRIEAVALAADLLQALPLEDAVELLADQADALRPGVLGEVRRDVRERELEIVDDRQELGQQAAVGVADLLLELLGGAPLVVEKVGLGALGEVEVRLGLAALLSASERASSAGPQPTARPRRAVDCLPRHGLVALVFWMAHRHLRSLRLAPSSMAPPLGEKRLWHVAPTRGRRPTYPRCLLAFVRSPP